MLYTKFTKDRKASQTRQGLVSGSRRGSCAMAAIRPKRRQPPRPRVHCDENSNAPETFNSCYYPLWITVGFKSYTANIYRPYRIKGGTTLGEGSHIPRKYLTRLAMGMASVNFNSGHTTQSLGGEAIFQRGPKEV